MQTSVIECLFPKKCIGCGKMGDYVCDTCSVGMWEEEQICPVCRKASRYGLSHEKCQCHGEMEGLTCIWAYEGVVRKLIQKVKYAGYYDQLRELWKISEEVWERPEFYYFNKFMQNKPGVVPIPLHVNRFRKRGFNQAEMIARMVFRQWGSKVEDILIREKDTGQQVGRDRKERLETMDNAFKVKKTWLNLSNVLLVDDVWTTGATMTECAKVLRKVGVQKIWGLVLVR